MIVMNINVSKIPKEKIVSKGKDKNYLDLVLFENKNGRDDFGNDGFVAVSVTKEEREAGERGPIIGNWKHIGQRGDQQQRTSKPPARRQEPEPDEEEIPF